MHLQVSSTVPAAHKPESPLGMHNDLHLERLIRDAEARAAAAVTELIRVAATGRSRLVPHPLRPASSGSAAGYIPVADRPRTPTPAGTAPLSACTDPVARRPVSQLSAASQEIRRGSQEILATK